MVDGATPGLLGRHVLDLAFEGAHLCRADLRDGLGDPEVAELDFALVADQDVVGRDIPVHQPELGVVEVLTAVCVVESIGDARDDEQGQACR